MSAAGVLRAPELALGPATLQDVEGIARLVNRYAVRGLMLSRTTDELYRQFREYVVVTGPNGEVLACGGLRVYSPSLAEIVGLAVEERVQGRGYGRLVVEALVEEARALGVPHVFAMTQEEGFFRRLGFQPVPHGTFPEKVHADCRTCARRRGCLEVAVLRELEVAVLPVGRARAELRVLQ